MRNVEADLARLLLVAALIAGTIEYAEIVKRRIAMLESTAALDELAQTGLQGLLRVFLDSGGTGSER